MFSIRTPTALVTDLGTEFGVEVDKSGVTESHVFQGKVEVRLGDGKGEARAIQLGVGESARVGPDRDQVIRIIRSGATAGLPSSAGLPSKPEAFVRQMPRWVPIKLFNTGIGLKEGDADPHWQLVAVSNDPDFKPRPAVTARTDRYPPNNFTPAQWISTAGDLPFLPHGVTYTFRTTFELTGSLPNTAFLRGRFIADNHAKAIRLNGKEVPTPEHADSDLFDRLKEFSARKGFVEGTNTLEIDVYNGGDDDPDANASSPMGLRVELAGAVFSAAQQGTAKDAAGQPQKGGETMNGP